jgi:hypothetical protein
MVNVSMQLLVAVDGCPSCHSTPVKIHGSTAAAGEPGMVRIPPNGIFTDVGNAGTVRENWPA